MNLQIFKNSEFGEVRAIEIKGEPWFVGKDIAEKLGYTNTKDALLKHVDAEDKHIFKGSDLRPLKNHIPNVPNRGLTIVNESGLYALVISSKLPKAKEFKRWVTSEILPAIRKHGAYITPAKVEEMLSNPDVMIKMLETIKTERAKNQELEFQVNCQKQLIGELQPKADYTDTILQSKSLLTITQIAKDYGMSGKAMNEILHNFKVQYKQGTQWLLYSKYHNNGYTHSKTININRKDGSPDVVMETKWTQKGRLFLYNLLKSKDILPVIEKSF